MVPISRLITAAAAAAAAAGTATLLCVVALLLAGGAEAGAATSAGYAACKLGSLGQRLGPTYVTSLSVKGKPCTFGIKVVRAYYKCRAAHGGPAGRCTSRVLGLACHETREGIKIQFDAKVTCAKGVVSVKHTYTQNT